MRKTDLKKMRQNFQDEAIHKVAHLRYQVNFEVVVM